MDTLIPLSPFIMVIAIIGFATIRKHAQDRHQAAIQKDILSKFSSAQELAEFLKTDGGKLLMPPPVRSSTPANRAGAGIIVVVIGAGIMAASAFSTYAVVTSNLRLGALIVMAAGIGLLISAFVTQKLAQKWRREDTTLQ